MAFVPRNVVLMGHGANVKLYSYESTTDTLATIRVSGYFDSDFAVQLRTNDMILVTDSNTDTEMLRVSVSGTTVTTVPVTDGVLVAQSPTTSTTFPVSGIVTITMTSVVSNLYHQAGAPAAGKRVQYIKLGALSSITIPLVGTTSDVVSTAGSSVISFGGLTSIGKQIDIYGSVSLLGISSTQWIVEQSNSMMISTTSNALAWAKGYILSQ